MDGFQILRCVWKCLDKMLQSIILEFSKAKNQTKQRPPKFFEGHTCQFWDNFYPIQRPNMTMTILYLILAQFYIFTHKKNSASLD